MEGPSRRNARRLPTIGTLNRKAAAMLEDDESDGECVDGPD